MTSKQLDRIGHFMKRWICGVVCAGYNSEGMPCFYIRAKGRDREIPFSWELIHDKGTAQAWQDIKSYLCRNYSFAYEAKSETLINSGFFEVV